MTAFVLIFSFITGALVGSFTNVLIYRLPRKENIAFPPSHCPHCDHRLGVLDLFPIFSWLYLRGKCRYCAKPILARYPIVELITAIAYTAIAYRFDPILEPLLTVGYWFLFTILLAGSAIDFETFELPDELTIPAIFVGLGIAALLGAFPAALEGALIGAGLIAAISGYGSWVLRRFREPVHPGLPLGYLNIHLAAFVGASLSPGGSDVSEGHHSPFSKRGAGLFPQRVWFVAGACRRVQDDGIARIEPSSIPVPDLRETGPDVEGDDASSHRHCAPVPVFVKTRRTFRDETSTTSGRTGGPLQPPRTTVINNTLTTSPRPMLLKRGASTRLPRTLKERFIGSLLRGASLLRVWRG